MRTCDEQFDKRWKQKEESQHPDKAVEIQEVQDPVEIQVSSYGLENCRLSNWRKRLQCCEHLGEDLTELMFKEFKDKWNPRHISAYAFNFESMKHTKALVRRIVEESPEHEESNICLVNCLNMQDPGHDPKMRSNTGYHPQTQKDFANNLSDED